ncbi:type I restriction endonuclease [Acinetobacter lwoffii]|uniref:type I restriction endonuclease n=1 Tax=Acinetobacter lwoffii TaxID=28090 RepID=UPI001FB378FB|nr:type I restriction endonuclease [Acinetobacter lwoffii]MCJ0929513.1 type I restriction endonuclease [Acinetobacter lwoffii]
MTFTEDKLEQAIINIFLKNNIGVINGKDVTEKVSPVLFDDLNNYLNENYDLTFSELNRLHHEVFYSSNLGVYNFNKNFMNKISNGFLFSRDDKKKPSIFIEFFNYNSHKKNVFKFVTQLKILGECLRIPDGILYINGIPLVVFEFKSAIREDATIYDAYQQLTVRYKRDIPELMKYNAICVISDGVNTKMGSLFAPYEFFYAWRKVTGDEKRWIRKFEQHL